METKTFRKPRFTGLSNGTTIKTTKPNEEKRSEWTEDGWNARKWDTVGEIIGSHSGHGFYYDVKHKDGTSAGYDPTEIEIILFAQADIPILTEIRSKIQSLLLAENLDITFYNPFNKATRSARKSPDRYLVCFTPSIEKRNIAFEKAILEKYHCKKGKVYEHQNSEGIQKYWTFTIDLIN